VGELSRLIQRGAISPVELTRLFLARLERLGPQFNAVAAVMPERALAEARRAEAALRRGASRGALHGIPYGAKDLLAARGAPTTWGAPPYRHQVLDDDATVVRRLSRAGAVLAAKLAMVELAGGGGYRYASASLQGPGRTPWDPACWSGGSSSGSGAAVAAGLVPFAIGSETSGSIITPASYCGVTGLRPTYGLVSRAGAMALSWTLDKLGPMARSAEDCALVLEAMAGPDPRDPSSARRRFRYRPLALPELQQLRLGVAPADFEELADQRARPAFAAALEVLRSLGAAFVEVGLPPDLPYGAVVATIIGAEASTIFAGLIESDAFQTLVDAKQKAGLRADLGIAARDYLNAMRIRARVQQAFRDLFRQVDVLVGVGRPGPATPIDQPLDRRASRRPAPPPARPANPALIPAGNLAGLPALCLPCGFARASGARKEGASELPVAIQLVGPPFAENRLLSLGAWFQAQTDWHRRRPPGCS
jgi:aspartyl-tRNA(Asn)/glutamyl-tRNA(Gln) amidotransferase subunit A